MWIKVTAVIIIQGLVMYIGSLFPEFNEELETMTRIIRGMILQTEEVL